MPGGMVMADSGGGQEFPAKLTWQVLVCTTIAAFGGFMFGYDIGISGGVTSMDDFLLKFFPNVYTKKHHVKENNYCKFDDVYLQLFTSSLYLAAIVASGLASVFCRSYGRKLTMQVASVFFFFGALFNVGALNLPMLIIGRLFLGAGVGAGNQAVPLFISEIAPAKYRGGLNICFQLLITVGILVANLVNYFTANIKKYGWRLSLGGAAVPAVILLAGSLIIVETPASLIERGKKEEGLKTLKKIRGVDNVEKEFEEIIRATEFANRIKHPYREVLKRPTIPPLICGTIIHIFQQFTGINVVMFYAPVLFQTMGFGSDASLLSAVITGTVNSLSTLIAIFSVDKAGRKKLLIYGALIMVAAQCIIGGILLQYLKSTNKVSGTIAKLVVVLICVFVNGFAWSWGPLGWLISSEIFPLETRNAGYFFSVATNMLCTFIIAQAFLTMLCHMRAYIFFFFAAWLVTMTVSVIAMLPETKGIPIDEMLEKAWMQHWFWKRFYKSADIEKPKQSVQLQQKEKPIG
ncbi:sugar transport protein 2-like [Durio zibethinus]|uniref:Sugar transport protein 2-like n=1 Tax=Durio zibethinus TaxID=66656 RepID=A0A6P5XW91_DURZI|nr:sugar transport protein 2-like [Durio zibethinus]